MNELVIFCKVTEEAKVEIELQKERRVEGFQRQVILLEIQYFISIAVFVVLKVKVC